MHSNLLNLIGDNIEAHFFIDDSLILVSDSDWEFTENNDNTRWRWLTILPGWKKYWIQRNIVSNPRFYGEGTLNGVWLFQHSAKDPLGAWALIHHIRAVMILQIRRIGRQGTDRVLAIRRWWLNWGRHNWSTTVENLYEDLVLSYIHRRKSLQDSTGCNMSMRKQQETPH